MGSVDETAWRDRQGDIWREGDDGLMHTPETAPFPREYVVKKWGPLTEVLASGESFAVTYTEIRSVL